MKVSIPMSYELGSKLYWNLFMPLGLIGLVVGIMSAKVTGQGIFPDPPLLLPFIITVSVGWIGLFFFTAFESKFLGYADSMIRKYRENISFYETEITKLEKEKNQ